MEITVNARIDSAELIHTMTRDQAKEAILAIDIYQGDGDFTLEVIEKLVMSLRVDYSDEELRKFLKQLRKKIK